MAAAAGHALDEDATSSVRAHGLQLLALGVLVERRGGGHGFHHAHGNLFAVDRLAVEMVVDDEFGVGVVDELAAICAHGTALLIWHRQARVVRCNDPLIVYRGYRQRPDTERVDLQVAAQLAEKHAVGHDGQRAVERGDAMHGLQLVWQVRRLRVHKHHQHVEPLDLLDDHGEHDFHPVTLGEVVHQLDAVLVDLQRTEAAPVVERERHFQPGNPR
ncbi:MAG: hypothetical protein Q9193_006201 [Seirophora villosa]